MKYEETRLAELATQFREKILDNSSEPHEIVVALLTMERMGQVDTEDIIEILKRIFNDKEKAKEAIAKAALIVDDATIDEIIKNT
jgi:hypothetical protein